MIGVKGSWPETCIHYTRLQEEERITNSYWWLDWHFSTPKPKIMSTILDNIGNTPLVRINRITQKDGIACELCKLINLLVCHYSSWSAYQHQHQHHHYLLHIPSLHMQTGGELFPAGNTVLSNSKVSLKKKKNLKQKWLLYSLRVLKPDPNT